MGADRAQGARGPDAARRDAKRPEPAVFDAHVTRARKRAGSHGDGVRAAARTAPAEPHRVRERDSRPARSRNRRGEVSAVRRFDRRLRQHRRRARHLVHARRGLRERGAEDRAARARLSRGSGAGRLSHEGRHVAGLSHRRTAVRHARRHARAARVPVGWRVHGDGDADLRRQHVADRLRIRAVREAGSPARRRAARRCSTGRAAGATPAETAASRGRGAGPEWSGHLRRSEPARHAAAPAGGGRRRRRRWRRRTWRRRRRCASASRRPRAST